MKKIKTYKGFDKDLKCRGYQYEIGKEYEHNGKIECCESGFHACENPFEVLEYYSPENSRYCEVEQSGELQKDDNGSKVASSKIAIKCEIGLCGLIDAGIKFILEKVDWKNAKKNNTGNYSAATNTGNYSAATNTGDYSAATNTGRYSAATNTGNYSAATNTGRYSAATNTGYCSAATNTGDCSAATNTGDYSAATNTGRYSAATNTGYCSAAKVGGKDSIAIVTGCNSKAAGEIGCWLVLTERDKEGKIKGVQTVEVDGKTIKANVFYKLVDGKIIESND